MDVDEELPGPSRASEDKANQASSVSQRVELNEETRALNDASLDNETNAAAGLDNEKNADAGLLRHRTDVCPTPNAVCSKCGASNPSQGHECIPNCAICGEEHATGDTSCRKKLKNVPPRISRVEQPRRKTEWTNKESEFPQLEQQRQKPHRWFSSEREEAAQQSRQGSRSPSRSRSRSRSQQQPTTTNRPEETPGKCNMKKISSSSGEKSSPQAGKAEDEAAAASRTTNQRQWERHRAAEKAEEAAKATSSAGKSRSRSRTRSPGRSRSRSRTPDPRKERRMRSRTPRRTATRDTETTEKKKLKASNNDSELAQDTMDMDDQAIETQVGSAADAEEEFL
ncbi:serine/arginine-rich splicing factor 4-like [Dermacentor silvarum]|uniref:serine/arginine-rich splicing factor 4-like n=1 Tax=Dermacentor silvarum TaxID=543639 RepID=UPI00189A6D13|nr:serine/arginine-rich splicing factor 4-like [Dermacentor silvarum]